MALEEGVPVKVVSERLGHSKSSTTQDLYQHVSRSTRPRKSQTGSSEVEAEYLDIALVTWM